MIKKEVFMGKAWILGICFWMGFTHAQDIKTWEFTNKWSGNYANEEGFSRVIVDGPENPSYIEKVFEAPVSFNKKFVKVKLKVSMLEKLQGIELRLSSDLSGYENFFSIPIPLFTDKDFNTVQSDSWMTYTFTMGEVNTNGNPDLDSIVRMGFYIGGDQVKVDFQSIEIKNSAPFSAVSFTFDDGYDDNFQAAQIMNKYGLSGTAYLMPRQVNTKNFVTTDNILQMKNEFGWDVSSHHKIPIVDFEYLELENELNYTLGYLTALGGDEGVRHFAYPLGKQNRRTTLPLIRRMFNTARLAGGGAETLPPADWHMLRTFNVMPHISPEEILERVRIAEEQGEWLILMFHYITDEKNPENVLAYNVEDFEKLCQLLYAEGTQILTVNQVYQAFQK